MVDAKICALNAEAGVEVGEALVAPIYTALNVLRSTG